MVKKQIIENINDSIYINHSYKNISNKLNFDNDNSFIPNSKKKVLGLRASLVISLLSIFVLSGAIIGLIIPHMIAEESFFVTKFNNSEMAICEGIYYKNSLKKYTEEEIFNVDLMIANRYYGRNSTGSIEVLAGTKEKPGYSFDAINISINNFNHELIKDYRINVLEYSKVENSIFQDVNEIKKDDFNLIYSFNLIDLIDGVYDNTLYFEINYLEKVDNDSRIFGKRFSTHLKKTKDSISLTNFNGTYESITYNVPISGILYKDAIDILSEKSFDYENPNYSDVMLHLTDARIYCFGREETKNLINDFKNIHFTYLFSDPQLTDVLQDKGVLKGISICVSFNYKNSLNYNNDVKVDFYVLENGTLAMLDYRHLFLFLSEPNEVNYENIYNLIKNQRNECL